MQNLIAINQSDIGGQTQATINARELHDKLGSQTRFNDWIRERIEVYQFVENQDFISFTENSVKPRLLGGRPTINYTLTLDMAKELAMVERSEMGRQIRRYFIQVEKSSKDSITQLQSQVHALQLQLLSDADQTLLQRIKRYKELGLNHGEIARLVELGTGAVVRRVRLLEKMGLLQPSADLLRLQMQAERNFGGGFASQGGRHSRPRNALSEQEKASIKQRHQMGLGVTEIGRQIGRHHQTISNFLRREARQITNQDITNQAARGQDE